MRMKIIDYLIEQECEFVLPYDYFCGLKTNNPSNLTGEIESLDVIKLNWNSDCTVPIDYKIQRSEDSICWVSIGTKTGNSLKYVDKVDTVFYVDTLYDIKPIYYYRVKINNGLNKGYTNTVKVFTLNNSIKKNYQGIMEMHPNPCNTVINLKYKLDKKGMVKGVLYNMQGREVLRLFGEVQNTGVIQKTIDVSSLSPGNYICQIITSDRKLFTNKIIVQR